MGRTNGAATESINKDDDDFDDDASPPLEFYWEQIAASRQRQDKPVQLTPEERCLTVEGCELLLSHEHEEEAAINKARAEKERIKRLRWTLVFVSAEEKATSSHGEWLAWEEPRATCSDENRGSLSARRSSFTLQPARALNFPN
jgi:hypothetical protein